MKRYLRIWRQLAVMSFLMQFTNRWSSLGWLGGKVVRLTFFLIFLAAIFRHVPSVAGYSLLEIVLFFVTFNLVDILAQLFFRGIYMVGRDIREGDMDFYLIQPVNPLFRISSNLVDFLDFLTLLPVLALALYLLPKALGPGSGAAALPRLALYLLLCVNGIVISFSLHVFIAALTVRTQQMENTIWMYRDLMSLGRFPADIYSLPLRIVLTTALPVAVMVSYPSLALLGRLSFLKILFAFVWAAVLLRLALWSWRSSLKHYSSVSS